MGRGNWVEQVMGRGAGRWWKIICRENRGETKLAGGGAGSSLGCARNLGGEEGPEHLEGGLSLAEIPRSD